MPVKNLEPLKEDRTMVVLRVLRQMGTWAVVFMMVGCVSPFAYKLVDPNYEPGNLEPPVYGFVGIIVGAIFGLILGIILVMRSRRTSSGGPPASGTAPTSGGSRPGPWGT